MTSSAGFLTDPRLAATGVAHGFGLRESPAVPGVVRPRQVHGRAVARVDGPRSAPGEADAVWTRVPGVPVGILTADCVPVLLASADGHAVAAVHAGWRGLVAGVLPAAGKALAAAGAPASELRAAIGPHIGPCCYEVDAPVLEALAAPFGDALAGAQAPVRPGHALLDLGALARAALLQMGVSGDAIGSAAAACTRCDAARFHSYRRDGERSGRLLHWVAIPRG